LRKDEFIGEDGLIHCKACGSARQMKVELFGKQDTVFCLCRCRTEKRDLKDEEYYLQARKAEIQQMKSDGLPDAALQRCTFANDLGYQPESAKLRAYVEQFPAMRKRGAGLLLWGDVGTGKTFLAACVANALLDQGILVRMPVTGELLNKLMGIYPSERNAFLQSLNACSLLILDDFGMEHSSEFAMTQLFNIVDGRYRTGKPLIVTTNLTLQELKNPPDLAHRRIYDRLLEMCTPIKVSGQNIRRLRAQENMREMRERLTTA
jgi:DNA replication protein DnaC